MQLAKRAVQRGREMLFRQGRVEYGVEETSEGDVLNTIEITRDRVGEVIDPSAGRNIVIVVAGLGMDEDGNRNLGFAHSAVVDWVARHVRDGDRVWITPGNDFGAVNESGDLKAEQFIARDALEAQGVQQNVVTLTSPAFGKRYLDTRDNAKALRRAAQETPSLWNDGETILVVYKPQLFRAAHVFDRELKGADIRIDRIVAVCPDIPADRKNMVPELKYYETKWKHAAYELLASAYFVSGLDRIARPLRRIIKPGVR